MCAAPAASPCETLPLFVQEVHERLSPTAFALLLRHAEIFVEGGAASGSSARGTFLGSAMLTFDLSALGERLRPPLDAALAERLRRAILADPAAQLAIAERALDVARARLAAPRNLAAGALQLRTEATRVLVDVELETGAARSRAP